MADKEPRRRKKRKELQKKDDLRSDEQIFLSTKSESRDSDQEIEEEFVVPSHEPSLFAKCVFVLLFSCLAVSMSFIFISLQGSEKGPGDIFNESHVEDHGKTPVIHDEGEQWGPSETSEEHIEDYLPGIGNILSFNDEVAKDVSTESANFDINENTEESREIPEAEVPLEMSSLVPDISIDQEVIHEYEEAIVTFDEYVTPSEADTMSDDQGSVTEDQLLETMSEVMDDIDSGMLPPVTISSSEITDEPESSTVLPLTTSASNTDSLSESTEANDAFESLSTTEVYEEETFLPVEQNIPLEIDPERRDEEAFSFYEKSDITNEADYGIREQLDEVDTDLDKDMSDNDDYDSEEEIEDEFDFWQF